MELVVMVLHVLAALVVIGLVLLQHGKGADMGAAFGSGSSGSLFGATGFGEFPEPHHGRAGGRVLRHQPRVDVFFGEQVPGQGRHGHPQDRAGVPCDGRQVRRSVAGGCGRLQGAGGSEVTWAYAED